MSRIWKNEGLEYDLSKYLYDLMVLMNNLIKKYSLSDDLGEYSKKKNYGIVLRIVMRLKNLFQMLII